MISVHSCRNKLFKARNWIWRGRGLGWGKREIQKQRWREERGGWNQPIWKRRDRKSLWQPSIMRFSLCGFLFTWKGINIKNAHYSPVYSHLFKLSLLHIHPSHSQWVLHLVNNHLTVYCKWSLFTWFRGSKTKMCLRRVIKSYVSIQTCKQHTPVGCHWMFLPQMLFWFNLTLFGILLWAMGGNKCRVSFSAEYLSAFPFSQLRTQKYRATQSIW